jgi:hypothetical protein
VPFLFGKVELVRDSAGLSMLPEIRDEGEIAVSVTLGNG